LSGFDGLLESGDLGLCSGLCVRGGRLSEGQGRDSQNGGQKKRFHSTMHVFLLPKTMRLTKVWRWGGIPASFPGE
jgi:hypothetical protein